MVDEKWHWRLNIALAIVGYYFFTKGIIGVIAAGHWLLLIPIALLFIVNTYNLCAAIDERNKWIKEKT